MHELITLNNLQKAKNEIVAVKDIKDILQIVDQAKALEAAAKAMKKSIEVQNEIAELTLRAKRKEGELIKQMKISGKIIMEKPKIASSRLTLNSLNITRNESSETQKIAGIQEDEFEIYIKETVKNKDELTTVGLIRANKRKEQAEYFKTLDNNSVEINHFVCDKKNLTG